MDDDDQPPDNREFDNPYAPPGSTFAPDPGPKLVAGMPFTVADVFNWSWAIFKQNVRLCLVIYWGTAMVSFAISLGLSGVLQAVTATVRDQTVFAVVNILVQFASIVIGVWLTVGQCRAFLRVARGQPVGLDEVFRGGPFVLTTILATIIFAAILAVPIMIAVVVITFGFLALENQLIAEILLFLIVSVLAGILSCTSPLGW